MKCPFCEEDMQPVDHNHRGLRCPSCWERVIVEEEEQAKAPPKPKPAAQRSTAKRGSS